MAQLRMEYVRALKRATVIVEGDFNYDPRRRGTETEVDRELRQQSARPIASPGNRGR